MSCASVRAAEAGRASYRLSISTLVCVLLDSVRLARSHAVCSLQREQAPREEHGCRHAALQHSIAACILLSGSTKGAV